MQSAGTRIERLRVSAEPVLRVFFALVPPLELQRTLGELARGLARHAHGRPVPAGNVHLTLAFVGAWPRSKIAALCDVAAAIRAAPMSVTLDVAGAFPRAGVAWIGPSAPPAALMRLAEELARGLAGAGVALDARAFHPHVTLARRCRGPWVEGAARPLAWDVDAMTLMASETRSAGARYSTLARREFTRSESAARSDPAPPAASDRCSTRSTNPDRDA